MIKGSGKNKFLTPEEVYDATAGGYDIYKYYLGKVSRQMNRPWGKKESKPSWGIYPGRGGYWHWKDQATEESGTAIQFVQRFFNLSFTDAMDKVCWDFGLGGQEVNASPVKVTWNKPELEEFEYCDIKFIDQPFKKEHHKFWNKAEVTEGHCNKMGCYAAKSITINKRRVGIMIDEPVFVFVAPDEGYKIYFPYRDKGSKFKNNVHYHYLWNYENLEPCSNLIVQKSFKDMVVTSLINPNVIATQAEQLKIFDQETIDKVHFLCSSPTLWWGSDPDGASKAVKVNEITGWNCVITPVALLPEINDTYNYTTHFGLKGLEEFMIEKHLI